VASPSSTVKGTLLRTSGPVRPARAGPCSAGRRETRLSGQGDRRRAAPAFVPLPAPAGGVGKTRLAREALGRAEEQRAATTWVVATPRPALQFPFGPFRPPSSRHSSSHRQSTGASPSDRRRKLARPKAEKGDSWSVSTTAHLLDEASACPHLSACLQRRLLRPRPPRDPARATPGLGLLRSGRTGLAERLEVAGTLGGSVADELVSPGTRRGRWTGQR